jgi:hypothetical protein
MKRSLTIGLAALFLAGCGGGAGGSKSVPAGTGAAPSQPKAQVRSPHYITKTATYTLTVAPYPSGFNTYCPESNLNFWAAYDNGYENGNNGLSFAGGVAPTIQVGSCNAATGDNMHVQLDVDYGTMRFIQTGNGNIKIDSVDDSGATLTVSDYTTGYSSNTYVYIAW